MNNETVNKAKSPSLLPTPYSPTPYSLLLTPYSLLPVLIVLLAAFLRLYLLPILPPGLNFDEAGNGVAAFDILRGEPHLWWRIGGGKEPLWPYLTAMSTAVLGNIPLALRLPAALAGILTVAGVYPLALVLYGTGTRRGYADAQLIALLTMLGLALSAWHLHFSRLGFRAILFPLLSALGFYFFWRGVRCQVPGARCQVSSARCQVSSAGCQVVAALFVGLAVYAYLAARLLVGVPAIFLVSYWLFTRFQAPARAVSIRRLGISIAQFYGFLLLFLSPLILYFAFNPADFMARSGTVSIFNPAWNQGDLPATAWRILHLTLGTFVGLTGDANPLVNQPGQPALPLVLVPFFLLGSFVAVYRIIRPSPPSSLLSPLSSLFLLTWWTMMLLPAILAPEGAPHHLRLIGTLVPTYLLVALGAVSIIQILTNTLSYVLRTTQHASRIAYLLPAACYILLFFNTYTHYFIRWPQAEDFILTFDRYAVRLADDIARAPANTTYVIPMDIRAGAEARHYTLDYLLAHLDPPPYVYLLVDEANAETILDEAAQNSREWRVVRWTQDKHQQADAKEIVSYQLATNAQLVGRESFPGYDVETYTVSASSDFQLPNISTPVNVTFDGLLRIDAVYLPPAVAVTDDWLPVALTLSPLAQMDTDYKVSLRLVGSAGGRVAQKDRALLHNYHQGTSLWPAETVNEYYLLPLPPDIVPDRYAVSVVIYHPETEQPLTAGGVAEIPLGTVQVE